MGKTGFDERTWWKEAVVYQVYPPSFCDANNDGLGDIQGIISRLDYLKDLGVDVLWLSPIYKSPQKDMGYDISDYQDIHEPYGSVADVDELIKGLHSRGMKLMMDLVVNHTSNEHAWFQESRSSRDNPKRDWYIWRDPNYNEQGERVPPNNWLAVFRGGPAWTWDEKTQQYYLRLYTPEQPDLNWENPEVRGAVHSLMRFWLDRGVDGFRMDVISFISKAPGLPDASITEKGNHLQPAFEHYANGPRVHEYLKELNKEVLSKYDVITVGETPFTHDTTVLAEYSRTDANELQMVFTFEHMDIDGDVASPFIPKKFKLSEFKGLLSKYQEEIPEAGGWNSLYIENHDQARSISRFGNPSEEFRNMSAKMLATMHCTLSGTVYVYQGQELAMANVPKDWTIEDYPDIASITFYEEIKANRQKEAAGTEPDMSDVVAGLQHKARDNARTPVQWDDSKNAGFSADPDRAKEPWMKVNADYKEYNAKKEAADPNSVLNFWKKAIKLRKANAACTYGVFKQVEPDNEDLFLYTKESKEQSLFVLASFSSGKVQYEIPEQYASYSRIFGNYDDTVVYEGTADLRPYEAAVFSKST